MTPRKRKTDDAAPPLEVVADAETAETPAEKPRRKSNTAKGADSPTRHTPETVRRIVAARNRRR